jgi:hypothetical protein
LANTAVAIFRVNVYWIVLKGLYALGNRWQVGCEGHEWWNIGTGCYPISSKHQLIHIHPKGGNCSVYQNTGKPQDSTWLIPEIQSYAFIYV